jgi:hypothetical protein
MWNYSFKNGLKNGMLTESSHTSKFGKQSISEGTEKTNGARGDHGCGLSGAQATAQKAVFNQASNSDVDMA